MDLHRTAFKMENAPYVPSPLTSPALMVLASTAEAGRDASVPCQPPRPFGVPVTLEKDMHLPFPTGSYTFTSLYHRQAGFAPREFPSSLLHLHPQFAPANLDCPPLSMLPHGGVGAFRPFPSSVEERDSAGYHSAFLPTKRLKGCVEPEAAARLHFADVEGKEFDFGGMAHANSGSPSALKTTEDPGKRQFGVSGLLADGEASCSPEEYKERCKLKGVCDTQTPVCPVCQDLLRPSELQEHMEHEMERLTQLHLSQSPSQTQCAPAGLPKSVFSLHIKREGGSCGSSPRPAEEAVHSDRYQMFLRVRANRQTRLGARIGKMKRRKTEEEQRDSVCAVENGSLGAGADEYGWSEHRRMHMVSILRGFRGLVSSTSKEPHDSDVDLDVDGDDTLSYGKAQYTETDVIPHCRDVEDGETVFNGHAAIRVSPECTKWSTPDSCKKSLVCEDTPSTSSEGHSKQDSSLSPTCKSCEIEMMCDDSLNTLEALKTRIRDLEKQLTRGDRIKCLICMNRS